MEKGYDHLQFKDTSAKGEMIGIVMIGWKISIEFITDNLFIS